MKRSERGGIIFRVLFFLCFLLFLGALYTVRHPLMRLTGRLWVTSDPLQHADAILILGDDNYMGDRAARAAELFREGWAPRVVASGRKLRPYAGIAELIGEDLDHDGVPSDAISAFATRATNTIEEAQALQQYVADHHWRRVIVVTSNYHARRARYIFRKIFPSNILVIVSSAPDSDFDPNSWWTTRNGEEIFLHETLGYCLAVWELRGAAPAKPERSLAFPPLG